MSMLKTKGKSNSCKQVAPQLPAMLDGQLEVAERRLLEMHLDGCAECAAKAHTLRKLHFAVKQLPVRIPPASLTTRLRVVASKECARRQQRVTLRSRWNGVQLDLRLWVNNLMRPLAIPATGGFLSAVLLFTMLLPGINARTYSVINDVPTGLYTDPTAKNVMPLAFSDDDLVVEVTVDENGRMVDYSIADCKHVAASPQLRRAVENNLLFSEFTPATTFGQPHQSKIRISFHNSRIDVRG